MMEPFQLSVVVSTLEIYTGRNIGRMMGVHKGCHIGNDEEHAGSHMDSNDPVSGNRMI